MDNWTEIKLGSLFKVKAGGDLQKSEYSNKKDELYPYPIYANSLKDKGLYGYTSRTRYPENSITITARGDIGQAEYRQTPFDAIVRLLVLIPKTDVDCRFVTYYINHKLNFPIESTGVPQLPAPRVKNIKINIPKNTEEQQAIAGILTKVDEALNATKQSIKATKKLKKALMQNLLTGKMKPDGSFRTEDEFYEDEKYGKVPKGWKIKKVKECFDYFPTASYSRSKTAQEGELMYIHYGDIHKKFNRIIDLNNEKLPFVPIELAKKYQKVKEGDIIFADASEDWNGVGKCVEILNLTNQKIISGLHTLHLRPKTNDFILGFASYLFETYRISTNIKRLATGIKVYGISKPNLSRVLLTVPQEDEQIEIRNQLDILFNKVISAERKIESLEKLKKSLMQHLLTGKKRVDVAKVNQLLNA